MKRTIDPNSGLVAMKTLKITVTDSDGVLLDRLEMEVAANCAQLAVRPIEGFLAERPSEEILTVGHLRV